MSVLGFVCEDECPVHRGVRCRLERGHAEAHKARLTVKLSGFSSWVQRRCGWMEIEWRRVPAAQEA
jgi:hypothetical protein